MNKQRKAAPRRASRRQTQRLKTYRQGKAAIRRLARKARLTQEQTEDLSQTVWLKFLASEASNPETMTPQSSLAWIITVALHEIAEHFRQHRRHPLLSLDALNLEPRDEHEEGGVVSAETERLRELVREWMHEQEVENALNYCLLYERDVTKRRIPELAAEAGMTETAVSCRIARMRLRLTRWLAAHGVEAAMRKQALRTNKEKS